MSKSQHKMRIGDQVIVTASHRDQHRNKLLKNTHGVVIDTSQDGDYFSYEVRWGDGPFTRVPRAGAANARITWVWTRHNPPIALRRAKRG